MKFLANIFDCVNQTEALTVH